MTDALEQFFLETVGPELCVFFCAMLPVIECRGAIPLGVALGLPFWETALLAVSGNLLPVPFILLFIRKILSLFRSSRLAFLRAFAQWLDKKVEKHKGALDKYSNAGLILFVGIPLPGTGAWTGSLLAGALQLDFKKSFVSVILGVLLASAVMLLGSYSVVGIFSVFL